MSAKESCSLIMPLARFGLHHSMRLNSFRKSVLKIVLPINNSWLQPVLEYKCPDTVNTQVTQRQSNPLSPCIDGNF